MSAAAGSGGESIPERFPWDTVMAVGFGLLRLSSAEFWAMSPREIERGMSFLRGAPAAGPERGAFAALMAAFPDKSTEAGHG